MAATIDQLIAKFTELSLAQKAVRELQGSKQLLTDQMAANVVQLQAAQANLVRLRQEVKAMAQEAL